MTKCLTSSVSGEGFMVFGERVHRVGECAVEFAVVGVYRECIPKVKRQLSLSTNPFCSDHGSKGSTPPKAATPLRTNILTQEGWLDSR